MCLGVLGQAQVTVKVIANTHGGVPIPPDMASFAVNIKDAPKLIIDDNGGPRASVIAMMGFLRNVSRSPIGANFRIGGHEGDEAVFRWNSSSPLPHSDTYRILPVDVTAFGYAKMFGGSITIGLNLRYGIPSEASAFAAACEQLLPGVVQAYEIGNEPNLYAKHGDRPSTYEYSDYAKEFQQWAQQLQSDCNISMPRLQGGVFSNLESTPGARWLPDVGDFIQRYAKLYLTSFSFHLYPLSPDKGTVPNLLQPDVVSIVVQLKPYATQMRALGKAFYVGEGSTIPQGGVD